jgi:hypothetical protein
MRQYNTACQHCGGLIAEPNKAYGFAGAFCHCEQRRSDMEAPAMPSEVERLRREVDDLRGRLARLEQGTARLMPLSPIPQTPDPYSWTLQDIAKHFPPGTVLC